MGIALATAAIEYGAEVVLVLGPVNIPLTNKSIEVIHVTNAASMASECVARFHSSDIAILSAAVADYTPVEAKSKKIKKDGDELLLRLKQTTDIAKALGDAKSKNQFIAGFALETDNEVVNASEKLHRKNMDIIVLNSLRESGAGFGHDTNKITIIDKYNNIDKFELKSKDDAAKDILNKIVSMIK